MEKVAQITELPFLAEVLEDEPHEVSLMVKSPDAPKGEEKKEYVFKLEEIPGAEMDSVEVLEDEPEEEVVEEVAEKGPKDEWDWEALGSDNFLGWLEERFNSIPKHKGEYSAMLSTITYCKKLIDAIVKATSLDFKRKIDSRHADNALKQLFEGIARLENQSEKIKAKKFKVKSKKQKKAEYGPSLVKEADTTISGNIIVTVPYLVSNVARACIDATVSGGRDMEEAFEKLASEYKLDKREKSQVAQLIKDMGYPIFIDRLNPFKKLESTTTDIKEYNQQFYA